MLQHVSRALTICSLFSAGTEGLRGEKDEACEAYTVSGPDAGYFQHYHFSDFRSISDVDDNNFTIAPELITTGEDEGGQALTSTFFNQTTWFDYWSINNKVRDADTPVPCSNSAQNVFIARNSTQSADSATYLALRASRPGAFSSTAEISMDIGHILYASLRARLRILPNSLRNISAPTAGPAEFLQDSDTGSNVTHPVDTGAVFGLFFYHNDTQETDIEILTRDATNQIRYTNQPDYDDELHSVIPGASTELTMPHDHVVTEWLDHRLDWFDGVTRWYIDNELVLTKTQNVPNTPCTVFMNLWSNGQFWSGNMSVGAQVYVGIQWVELVYNSSQHNDQHRTSGRDKRKWIPRPDLGKRNQEQGNCEVDKSEVGEGPTASSHAAHSPIHELTCTIVNVLLIGIHAWMYIV